MKTRKALQPPFVKGNLFDLLLKNLPAFEKRKGQARNTLPTRNLVPQTKNVGGTPAGRLVWVDIPMRL